METARRRVGVLRGGLGDLAKLRFERGDASLAATRGERAAQWRRLTASFDLDRCRRLRTATALRPLLVGVGLRGDVERLRALGVVAVDGDGLDAARQLSM